MTDSTLQPIRILVADDDDAVLDAYRELFANAAPAASAPALRDLKTRLLGRAAAPNLLLVDAGGDTTRNLLASGLISLIANPDQLAWLKADLPARLPAAREELLRYTSPVVYMRRTATRDAALGGQAIKAGQKVVMFFGAANRDAAHFAEPHALRLDRTPNEHMAFGNGPHVCLGQHLARIEIDAVLTEVLTRMDDLALAAPPVWLQSNFIAGPTQLEVTFRPGAALGCMRRTFRRCACA